MDRGGSTCLECKNNNHHNNGDKVPRRRNIELRQPETEDFIRLNVNVFQTQYSKNFYNDVAKSGEYSKLAYVDNQLAGGIGVRIQLNPW